MGEQRGSGGSVSLPASYALLQGRNTGVEVKAENSKQEKGASSDPSCSRGETSLGFIEQGYDKFGMRIWMELKERVRSHVHLMASGRPRLIGLAGYKGLG